MNELEKMILTFSRSFYYALVSTTLKIAVVACVIVLVIVGNHNTQPKCFIEAMEIVDTVKEPTWRLYINF
jgi:hypothetical protein